MNLEEAVKVIAYLVREDGKISTGKFNRIYSNLGYDKLSQEDVMSVARKAEQDPYMSQVFSDVYSSKIDFELPNGKVLSEDAIMPVVSPAMVSRELNNASVRNYKKAQKALVAQEIISNRLIERMVEELAPIVQEPVKLVNTDLLDDSHTLVVGLSDWHIGATVKGVNGNTYNLEVAQERLDKFLQETIETIINYGISHVYIVHLGDYAEGIGMRNINQPFDAEIDLAEQIAKATRMLTAFIRTVSSHTQFVTFGGVGGNHDRYTANKKEAIYNDNIGYNIIDTLELLNGFGALGDNVEIIDNRNDVYSFEFDVYGKTFRAIHGDNIKNNDSPKIPVMLKDHMIDYVMFGHYHSSKIIQENGSATSMMVGSLQGNNTYSKQLNLPDSKASQLLVIMSANNPDSPMFRPVYL